MRRHLYEADVRQGYGRRKGRMAENADAAQKYGGRRMPCPYFLSAVPYFLSAGLFFRSGHVAGTCRPAGLHEWEDGKLGRCMVPCDITIG